MNKTRNFLCAFIMFFALLFSGCEKENQYGKCVGIDEDKNPNLTYKISTRNVILGVLFFEILIPPIVVLASETYCPTGYKQQFQVPKIGPG